MSGEAEGAAHAGCAEHIKAAAHQLHQSVADGQAQARATIAAGGLAIGLREGVKQLLDLRRVHANASVPHADLQGMQSCTRRASRSQSRALTLDGDHNFALVGELDGIAHQIVEHLAESQRVAHQMAGHIRGDGVHHLNAFFFGPQRGDGGDGFQNIVQRKLHSLQREHGRLDLGVVKNVVDDGQQRVGR